MSFGNNSNTLTYGNLTANGSFGNLASNIFSSAPSSMDYLIVGGGGGGGLDVTISDGYAAGGGAGGGGAVLRSFNTSSGDTTTPINASVAGIFTIVTSAVLGACHFRALLKVQSTTLTMSSGTS